MKDASSIKLNNVWTKRKKVYFFAAWMMTGLVLLYAAFFTFANGFGKISFSIANNDIYDVEYDFAATPIVEDCYIIGGNVDFDHTNVKYLRLKAKGISEEGAYLLFRGGYFDEDEEFKATVNIDKQYIKNGNNDYRLPSNDFEYFSIGIYGENKNVIQGIQFRESIEEVSYAGEILVLSITAAVYLMISIFILMLIRR